MLSSNETKEGGEDNENVYLTLLREVLETGHLRETRNGKTRGLFGKQIDFDLRNNNFPLITTKKMFMRGIFEELSFFLQGKTDSKELEKQGVNIWKPNTTREFLDKVGLSHYKEGEMGPMYFHQILHFNAPYEGADADYSGKGFDQLEQVIHLLKTDRFSRRMIMTTYNPLQRNEGVLYPCHGITIQFGIEGENELCCLMLQRSCDLFHGLCFNIASYALFMRIICEYVNGSGGLVGVPLVLGKLTISIGDCHIYESHIDAVKEQLTRTPYPFPTIQLKKEELVIEGETKEAFFSRLSFRDIEILGYKSHSAIRVDMVA